MENAAASCFLTNKAIKMSVPIAIIAGAGPGTGSAIARRFAQAYPVVVLARSQLSLDPLVQEIKESGGSAMGIPTDVTSSSSMQSTMDQIKTRFGSDLTVAAAIYNVASKFTRKPFLEQSEEELLGSLEPSVKGAFNFAHATLPAMLNEGQRKGQYPPTLVFTGKVCWSSKFKFLLTMRRRCHRRTERRIWTFWLRDEQVRNPCHGPIPCAGIRSQRSSCFSCYY